MFVDLIVCLFVCSCVFLACVCLFVVRLGLYDCLSVGCIVCVVVWVFVCHVVHLVVCLFGSHVVFAIFCCVVC